MGNSIAIVLELAILVLNIIIFWQLTVLKKDCLATRLVLWIGSALSLAAFAACVHLKVMPETTASFVCVTIPTFLLFFSVSKYKDSRFFATFCFLDTVTLIITFFARAANILFGDIIGLIAAVVAWLGMLVICIKGKKLFRNYRDLLVNVKKGWGIMAVSTFLIYLLLIFSAAYPKPLVERPEYLSVYAVISVTVLSFYTVYLTTLMQKKALADLNAQLLSEKKWHDIAYIDPLTNLNNRMAYIERANTLERTLEQDRRAYAVMIDIDNFKAINDRFGHHTGDVILKRVAEYLQELFAGAQYHLSRIGGDEFAVIALDISEEELEQKIQKIHNPDKDTGCRISCGCARVDLSNKNAVENAFILADTNMYRDKEAAKKAAGN